jgi:predicted ArsR family transcriptional regulator
MGVRLKAGAVKVTTYQKDIAARREMLEELAKTGMTRQAASVELGVSEATVRRDIMIMKITWMGDAARDAYEAEPEKTQQENSDGI